MSENLGRGSHDDPFRYGETQVTLGELGIHATHLSADTRLSIRKWSADLSPEVLASIVVPVHNMEKVIEENLQALAETITSFPELAVILDSCSDASQQIVEPLLLRALALGRLHSLTIVTSVDPLYETLSDRVGIAVTSGQIILEVQPI